MPKNKQTNFGQTYANKGLISFLAMELKAARHKIGVETTGGQINQSRGLLKIVFVVWKLNCNGEDT